MIDGAGRSAFRARDAVLLPKKLKAQAGQRVA